MTTEQTSMLVFKDQAGDYFLVTQETLQQVRVPEERREELEQLLGGAGDVSGYVVSTTYTILRFMNAAVNAIDVAIAGAASPPSTGERNLLDYLGGQVGGQPT